MHNPLFGGRGMIARFAQYAGFRPKVVAKGKNKAKDDDDTKDDDKDAASDAPEHGDTGDDPSDDHMAESDDDDESMQDDDDDDEKMQDDDDEDDDEDKKKKARKKARRAESDDDDEKMADDDDDKKEARRMSRAMRRSLYVRAFRDGRRAERTRWTKVFSSPLAAANLESALTITANTWTLSAGVLSQLRKLNSASVSSARRNTNPRIGVDNGDALAPDQRANATIQASWAKAFAPTVELGAQRKAAAH